MQSKQPECFMRQLHGRHDGHDAAIPLSVLIVVTNLIPHPKYYQGGIAYLAIHLLDINLQPRDIRSFLRGGRSCCLLAVGQRFLGRHFAKRRFVLRVPRDRILVAWTGSVVECFYSRRRLDSKIQT